MVRTHVIACKLPRARADALNLESGRVYTGVLVVHWRTVRKKNLWLSEGSAKCWSDTAHQRQDARPYNRRRAGGFLQGVRDNQGVAQGWVHRGQVPALDQEVPHDDLEAHGDQAARRVLELSCGGRTKKERKERKISLPIPTALRDCRRFLESAWSTTRKARRYFWHIVVENGKQPKPSPGGNVVAVDLGEIHPAVVGDEAVATVITCRERRAESQGHTKRLAKIQKAASRKQKGLRSHRRLMKAKLRMKAKHGRVMRDMEHKISRTIVATAVERKAGTIAIGDIRDIADGVDCGTVQNGRMSRWNYGKISDYVEYKAAAEGIVAALVDEHHTSQTCPNCEHRHKPRGANTAARSAGFSALRRGWSGQHLVGVSSWRAREDSRSVACQVSYPSRHEGHA